MKIGIISDTHIPDRATALPKAVLQGLKGVDMIIHAGDILDITVLDVLKTICKDTRAVHGNMDGYELQHKLPTKQIIEVGKLRIGVMHGLGPPNKLIPLLTDVFKNDKVNVVIFGHSHYPVNEKFNDILFFNPGSPTDKIFAPYNSYGIIEIEGDHIEAKIIKIN